MASNNAQVDEWLSLYGDPDLNLASVLCDDHPPESVAFTFIDSEDLSSADMTFGELRAESTRLAAALKLRGVEAGDRVPVLMGKRRELVISLLALWRLGAVHVPLFTAFAKGAIELRVYGSGARLVLTEPSQIAKLDGIDVEVLDVVTEYVAITAIEEPAVHSVAVGASGTMVQLFTSGTTGKPKRVAVPAAALASFRTYMHYGLDVQPEDVFWNAADPGWAYGLYYGVIGPLVTGRRNLMVSGTFDPAVTVDILHRFGVTNFAGAPTVYRALSQLDTDLPQLRRASSAGEPLTPDVVSWGLEALGLEVRDHYGQTELGMVVTNGWHEDVLAPVKTGSMGRPLPGFEVDVVQGQLAVSTRFSRLLWFDGYVDDPRKSAERFTADGSWYLTSDSVQVDDDGYVFFTARDDDVILAAGYRIGPFEVESVLATHPSVAEVAVVGRPDPDQVRGEVVEAFVVPGAGITPTADLATELQELVRNEYSKHAYPRRVHFVEALPKTPSGKVQRFMLRGGSTE